MLKKYFGIFTGIIAFIVYLTTIAPSVVEGDASELAIVQATLGISHPTGYPLFTLLGHLFYLLPLPFSPIFTFNLLSSVYCSLSVIFVAYIIKLILENSSFVIFAGSTKEESTAPEKGNDTSIILASVFGALLWAFSYLVWYFSASTEVYSLHICLISAIVYFSLKTYFTDESDKSYLKYWIIIGVLLALSFSHHLTIIYLIPGLFLLLYYKHGISSRSFKLFLLTSAIIIAGVVLLYSYLIIRAQQNPFMNWGDPSTLKNLFIHITGGQYHNRVFTDFNNTLHNLWYLSDTLFNIEYWEFNIGIFISLAGIISLLFVNKRIFAFLATCILVTMFISSNYKIVDIYTHFCLIYFSLSISAGIGMYVISIILKKYIPRNAAIAVLSLVILVFEFGQNYKKVDRSDYYILEDYTKEILYSVDENAIVVINEYSPFLFSIYYYQIVENIRPDVAIVCITIDQEWYKKSLAGKYPHVLDAEQNQFDIKVEDSPVYVISQLIKDQKLPEGYHFKPGFYLFKVDKNKDYMPVHSDEIKIRTETSLKNLNYESIQENICVMLENRALYEYLFNNKEGAEVLLEQIKKKFPDYNFTKDWDKILRN
jgi:hypothetical protein